MEPHWRERRAFWPHVMAYTALAALLAAPIVALAVVVGPRQHDGWLSTRAPYDRAPTLPPLTTSVATGTWDVGEFPFGDIEFGWNPKGGGVPDFDSWPPGSQRSFGRSPPAPEPR
jgi:hypothetical protein